MGKKRYVASCPEYAKDMCPNSRQCRAKVFTPRREDGPKGLDIPERQESALEKIKAVNKGRGKYEKYKPLRDKNGGLVPAKDGTPGHILAFACYPKTEQQKQFVKDYEHNTRAFTAAAKNLCTSENGYKTAEERRQCISEHINRVTKGL
jgi:hypothetical protein